MLADHAPEGGGENRVASTIEDILRGLSSLGSGDIRVLVPKGKSLLDHWIGSVYVVEAGRSLHFKIDQEGGTSTDGGYSGGLIQEVNPFLPAGTFLNQTFAGDPVNVANGNLFRDEVDFVFSNRGIPLTFGAALRCPEPLRRRIWRRLDAQLHRTPLSRSGIGR